MTTAPTSVETNSNASASLAPEVVEHNARVRTMLDNLNTAYRTLSAAKDH